MPEKPCVTKDFLRDVFSEKKQLFNFVVESTGALRPELIVLRGLEVLKRKLKNIRAKLREAEEAMET